MENLNNQTTSEFSDEIELKLLFKGIWLSRYFIILLSFIGATFSVFYAISIPDTYKSEATVLVETNDNDAAGMSQYSGLASMAGISLGGSSANRKDEILHTMISRKFINEFVNHRDILIPLFAFEALGLNKETYTINNEIFNKTKNSWVDGAFKTKDGNPSQQDIFNTFTDHLKIDEDFSTGFITISIIHESPVLSDQWLKWFIEDVNMHVKSYDMNQSEKALNYLEEKLIDSNIPDINKVLISMTQEEIRKMMLINIREEYILRTIDPSILPLKKIAPSRASLCITITATSFILSILLVTILSFFRRSIMVRFMPPRLAINIF